MSRWQNALQTSDEIFLLKRRTVLKESGRLFSRQGYHNTSLDDVAKELGVAKGTLYKYVTDKQEILFEFHKMALDIGDRTHAAALADGESGADKLRLAIHGYIAAVNEELGGYGVIAELQALRPKDRETIVERRDNFDAGFVEIILGGIADGSLRDIDAKVAIFTFMGALQIMPRWYSPTGRLSATEVADEMTDILMNGLATIPILKTSQ